MGDFDYIDAHVHTAFSQSDCQRPMDDYLQMLRDGIARGFGFTDHLHPGLEEMGRTYANYHPFVFDGAAYCKAIEAARAQGLCVYKGVEGTYEKGEHALCQKRAMQDPYDYIVGSAHSYDGFWVTRTYWQNVQPGQAFLDIVNRYYDAVLDVLDVPWFDMVAHIGVYKRFLPPDHRLLVYAHETIEMREQEVARACAQSGKVIEVNTSGLTAPGQRTMPSDTFLQKYLRYGGHRVCLASDGHDTTKVNQCFAQAAQMLRDLGFTYLTYPWDPDHPEML